MSWMFDNEDAISMSELHAEERAKREAHRNRRNSEWAMKDGKRIKIKDMSDSHLYNAYNMFGDARLMVEIIERLFLERIK